MYTKHVHFFIGLWLN